MKGCESKSERQTLVLAALLRTAPLAILLGIALTLGACGSSKDPQVAERPAVTAADTRATAAREAERSAVSEPPVADRDQSKSRDDSATPGQTPGQTPVGNTAPMGRPAAGTPAASAMIETGPAGMVSGGTLEITRSWVRIFKNPDFGSRAVGVAYGNDTLTVLKEEGDWVQVQFGRKQTGWVPLVDPPLAKKSDAAKKEMPK